jgi:hypothetical protein
LRELPVEFNRPNLLLVGHSTAVQVVIRTGARKQEPDQLFNGFEGQVKDATALVGEKVSAELYGPHDVMEITPQGEKMRTITREAPVTWIWDVKPLKPGKAHVVLELYSHVKLGKEDEPVEFRVMQDTWTMEARGFERVKYWISEIDPVVASLGSIITVIGGIFAWRAKKGQKDNKG